jgi:hypothetical protein
MKSPLLTSLFAAFLTLPLTGTAFADGEAGLVIHYGDGRVDTYCIAFEGDAITGDRLLQRAGLEVNQFSGLVCAIDGTGCAHSGSFDSCTCQCRSGSSDCAYWSFFTQPYGETWRYSILGFFSAKAADGDMQAWKWGEGSAASAPPPPGTTFEAVCGHAPRGAAAPPTLPASTVPAVRASPTPTPASSPEPPAAPDTPTVPRSSRETAPPSATATPTGASPTPAAPSAGARPESAGGDDSSQGGLIAFAAAAGALIVAIALTSIWRRRHGS